MRRRRRCTAIHHPCSDRQVLGRRPLVELHPPWGAAGRHARDPPAAISKNMGAIARPRDDTSISMRRRTRWRSR
jgi:hypothetical protein